MVHADQMIPPSKAPNAELADRAALGADFRVERKEAQIWRISLLAPRARHWFEASFAKGSQITQEFETNLAGANAFIRKARVAGFRTEYIGPLSRSYF
ncbi:hypothetical protein [Ensifer sp. LCM 4579]|uniref:hypothetical protein n=1 Tax=Ensifer sp. LCM 4579 TaxID=1848292 RepID=UPI0008D99116|nr:hypothetical protein [Ensifer sp. LCM 4579]OHV78454.1 hypothetical protein LCM4579_25990 [Ensifer sp. LCM 4579]